jgi:hypothetical protein
MAKQFTFPPRTAGATEFYLDGASTAVNEDTVTPANSVPLPVKVMDSSGSPLDFATETTLLSVDAELVTLNATDFATDAKLDTIIANQTNSTQKAIVLDSGGNALSSKTLGTQVVSGDRGLIMNSVIHGLNSGGGGTYVDVKVNPSGSLLTEATVDITEINGAALSATNFIPSRLTDGSAYYQGATQTTLAALDAKVTACNTGAVTVSSSALPTGAATQATLSTLNGKIPSNLTVVSTRLTVDGSGVTQPVSGTFWQATQPVSIAATVSSNTAQIAGTATSVNAGAGDAGTQRVAIAKNTNGDNAEGTVSTVATLTAPANAVGFILMSTDVSTANIRYRIGATATSSSGQQLQPGRDTGFIPCAANISICAESGTQNYNIQWILSS